MADMSRESIPTCAENKQTENISNCVGIDTVSIEIQTGRAVAYDEFKYGFREIISNDGSGSKTKLILTRPPELSDKSFCIPRVEYLDYPCGDGGRSYLLLVTIESCPKFFFGNSIMELCDDDLGPLVERVLAALVFYELPVDITIDMIKEARVREFHCGKNTLFVGAESLLELLSVLPMADLSSVYKRHKIKYGDGGDSVDISITNRHIILYDRLAKYNKEPKLVSFLDSDEYEQNYNLINDFVRGKSLSIPRFEVQMGNNKQIKRELKAAGLDDSAVTFRELFDSGVTGAILRHHWNKITERMPSESSADFGEQSLIKQFNVATETSVTPSFPYMAIGFRLLWSVLGASKLKTLHKSRLRPNSWYDIKGRVGGEFGEPKYECVRLVAESIKNMLSIDIEGATSGDGFYSDNVMSALVSEKQNRVGGPL